MRMVAYLEISSVQAQHTFLMHELGEKVKHIHFLRGLRALLVVGPIERANSFFAIAGERGWSLLLRIGHYVICKARTRRITCSGLLS